LHSRKQTRMDRNTSALDKHVSNKPSVHQVTSIGHVNSTNPSPEPAVFFPLFVDLRGRKCVVVGGGAVAARKIAGLLGYGAQVTVVSPRAVTAIRKLVQDGKAVWVRRKFAATDLDGAFLAIAATAAWRVNAAVYQACAIRGVLCNSVDDPEHCDFIYAAVMHRGPLQIAVSTSGASPALAARLRLELEDRFGEEWALWVERLSVQRRALLDKKIPARRRTKLLADMSSDAAFRAFLAQSGCAHVDH
jgi:siroheme synthase-like protein